MIFQLTTGFQQAFQILQQLGLLDVILPFALIFSIIYAVLKQFGPDFVKSNNNWKINLVISLSITLLMVVPHVVSPSPNDMISIINRSLPEIGLVLIAIVLVMILTGLTGKPTKPTWLNEYVVPYGALLLIAIIFYRSIFPSTTPSWLNFISDPTLQALLIVLLVFGLVVFLVVGLGENKQPQQPQQPQQPL